MHECNVTDLLPYLNSFGYKDPANMLKVSQLINIVRHRRHSWEPLPEEISEKVKRLGINEDTQMNLMEIYQEFGFLAFCMAFSSTPEACPYGCSISAWAMKILLIEWMAHINRDNLNNLGYPILFYPKPLEIKNLTQVQSKIGQVLYWVSHYRSTQTETLSKVNPLTAVMMHDIARHTKEQGPFTNNPPMSLYTCCSLLIDALVYHRHHKSCPSEALDQYSGKRIDLFSVTTMEVIINILTVFFTFPISSRSPIDEQNTSEASYQFTCMIDPSWSKTIFALQNNFAYKFSSFPDYAKLISNGGENGGTDRSKS